MLWNLQPCSIRSCLLTPKSAWVLATNSSDLPVVSSTVYITTVIAAVYRHRPSLLDTSAACEQAANPHCYSPAGAAFPLVPPSHSSHNRTPLHLSQSPRGGAVPQYSHQFTHLAPLPAPHPASAPSPSCPQEDAECTAPAAAPRVVAQSCSAPRQHNSRAHHLQLLEHRLVRILGPAASSTCSA